MQSTKKSKSYQSYVLKCDRNKEKLVNITEKFADKIFYVEVRAIIKENMVINYLARYNLRFASLDRGDKMNLIFVTDKRGFKTISDLIMQYNVKDIVLYFPKDSISFEKFLYNTSFSFHPQQDAIIKKLCAMICTWVTKKHEIYFDFDPSEYNISAFNDEEV